METAQPSSDVASNSKEEPLTATCHCGRVCVQIPFKPASLNECHCTVCYKYGALWAYFPRAKVVITTASDTTLQSYIRDDNADGNLEFVRCAHCGCMVCWRGVGAYAATADPEEDTGKMGVNCRMLPEKEIEGIAKRVSPGPVRK